MSKYSTKKSIIEKGGTSISKTCFILSLFTFFISVSITTFAQEINSATWGKDFEKALSESVSSEKPLWIYFRTAASDTGERTSCPYCDKFETTVLSNTNFIRFTDTTVVRLFVEVDIKEEGNSNNNLLALLPDWNNIRVFPNVVITFPKKSRVKYSNAIKM